MFNKILIAAAVVLGFAITAQAGECPRDQSAEMIKIMAAYGDTNHDRLQKALIRGLYWAEIFDHKRVDCIDAEKEKAFKAYYDEGQSILKSFGDKNPKDVQILLDAFAVTLQNFNRQFTALMERKAI